MKRISIPSVPEKQLSEISPPPARGRLTSPVPGVLVLGIRLPGILVLGVLVLAGAFPRPSMAMAQDATVLDDPRQLWHTESDTPSGTNRVGFGNAQSDALIDQITVFQDNWKLVGITGILILLFFSSLAFTVLENAMSVIFHHRVAIHRRHFLVSAVIPFLFIVLIGAGLLLITLISGALQSIDGTNVTLFGAEWNLQGTEGKALYLLGVGGLVTRLR